MTIRLLALKFRPGQSRVSVTTALQLPPVRTCTFHDACLVTEFQQNPKIFSYFIYLILYLFLTLTSCDLKGALPAFRLYLLSPCVSTSCAQDEAVFLRFDWLINFCWPPFCRVIDYHIMVTPCDVMFVARRKKCLMHVVNASGMIWSMWHSFFFWSYFNIFSCSIAVRHRAQCSPVFSCMPTKLTDINDDLRHHTWHGV